MDFYSKVKGLCAKRGVSITALVNELGFSSSAATTWKNSKNLPRESTIKKVAEYFNVPIEYLLGTEVQSHTIKDNHGVIGNTHAPVTIVNGSERTLSNGEVELLRVFNSLDVKRQTSLLTFAFGLEEEISYSMAARGAEGVVQIHNRKEKEAIDRAFDTADDK